MNKAEEKAGARPSLGTILADHQIKRLVADHNMIDPFHADQVRFHPDPFPSSTGEDDVPRKVISYGVSSYGYDIRAAAQFKVFTNVFASEVDPKNFDPLSFVDVDATDRGYCLIPPNSFALARSVEYMKIPRDVLVICLGKSTYARIGIVVNVTPLEPGWEGHITLEFSNTTPLPARVYANEGCAQLLFFQGDSPCSVSYKDRDGKYQGQTGVTLPKV